MDAEVPVQFVATLRAYGYEVDEIPSLSTPMVPSLHTQFFPSPLQPPTTPVTVDPLSVQFPSGSPDEFSAFFSKETHTFLKKIQEPLPPGHCPECYNHISKHRCTPPLCALCKTVGGQQYVDPEAIAARNLDKGIQGVEDDFRNLEKGALHKVNDKGKVLRKYLAIAHLAVMSAIQKGIQPQEVDKQRITNFQKALTEYNEENILRRAANSSRFPQNTASNLRTSTGGRGHQPLGPSTSRINSSQQALLPVELLVYNPQHRYKGQLLTGLFRTDERYGTDRDIHHVPTIKEEIEAHEQALQRFETMQKHNSIAFHTRQLALWRAHLQKVENYLHPPWIQSHQNYFPNGYAS